MPTIDCGIKKTRKWEIIMTRNEVACTIGGIGLGIIVGAIFSSVGTLYSSWTITGMSVIGFAIIFISGFIRKSEKEKTA